MTMSRNQNGAFNKFLNFIGLVDDDREQPTRSENPYGSESYGRSGYTPRNASQSNARRSAQPTRSLPQRGSASRYESSDRGDRYNDRPRSSSRYSSDYEQDYDQDYDRNYDAPRNSRPRSRFEEEEIPEQEPAPQPRPTARSASANSTMMFTLRALRDANQVIKELVRGTTIIVTLNTQDEHTAERIVDTLSGAVFALEGTIRKASPTTFLLAPRSVNVAAYEGGAYDR